MNVVVASSRALATRAAGLLGFLCRAWALPGFLVAALLIVLSGHAWAKFLVTSQYRLTFAAGGQFSTGPRARSYATAYAAVSPQFNAVAQSLGWDSGCTEFVAPSGCRPYATYKGAEEPARWAPFSDNGQDDPCPANSVAVVGGYCECSPKSTEFASSCLATPPELILSTPGGLACKREAPVGLFEGQPILPATGEKYRSGDDQLIATLQIDGCNVTSF